MEKSSDFEQHIARTDSPSEKSGFDISKGTVLNMAVVIFIDLHIFTAAQVRVYFISLL